MKISTTRAKGTVTMPRQTSNTELLTIAAAKLANVLEVPPLAELYVQAGTPQERADQFMGAVLEIVSEAYAQFGPDEPDEDPEEVEEEPYYEVE
jgi:hypothetical protein